MTDLTILPEEKTTAVAERGYRELLDMAEEFSKSSLCPKHLKGKAQDIAVVMLAGRDYGISDFQAVFGTGSLYVIDGRLSMEAQLMRALCLASPACKWIREIQSSDTKSVWATQRAGVPEVDSESFTLEEARAQGLLNKPNWKGNPGARTMLSHRACARLCRRVYPDVLKGITYTPEEIREIEAEVVAEAPAPQSRVEALVASIGGEAQAEPSEAPQEAPAAEPEASEEDFEREVKSQEYTEAYVAALEAARSLEEVNEVFAKARADKELLVEDDIRKLKDSYTEALARLK